MFVFVYSIYGIKRFTLYLYNPSGSHQGPHEKRLLNTLLNSNYNTLERPVSNESDALTVRFGLTLQQIIDVVRALVCTLNRFSLFFFGHSLRGWQVRLKGKNRFAAEIALSPHILSAQHRMCEL